MPSERHLENKRLRQIEDETENDARWERVFFTKNSIFFSAKNEILIRNK